MASSSDFPIVLVKNLPYDVSSNSLFDLLSSFGDIHQLRIPDSSQNKGSCFAIYYDMNEAMRAAKRLNGMNYQGRYLVSTIYSVDTSTLGDNLSTRWSRLQEVKEKYSIEWKGACLEKDIYFVLIWSGKNTWLLYAITHCDFLPIEMSIWQIT